MNCSQERWPNDRQEEDGDEDVLSLSDLPVTQHESSEEREPLPPQHDFHFCCSPSKQSEMRPADEIFFQGQIKCLSSDSICSHHSSTSTATPTPRNLFNSHPSPSPRILSNDRQLILRNNFVKKPWSWSVLTFGPIAAPPEIAFRGPKTRSSCKNSGGGSEKKFRVKSWDLAGVCKCSVDVAFMKRSPSDSKMRRRGDEENSAAAKNIHKPVTSRTFEP